MLFAREVDWRNYSYLSEERGLELVADYGSIVVYRDLLWHSSVSTALLERIDETDAIADFPRREILAQQNRSLG